MTPRSWAAFISYIRDPGVLEGALPRLSSLLLESFNGSFVDSATFVDQSASCGRLARIYMFDDDDVDMSLFFSDFGLDLALVLVTPVLWQQTRCEKALHFINFNLIVK